MWSSNTKGTTMSGSQNVNLNSADCIYEVSDFGVNHIHNICTGTVTDLALGLGSYASFAIIVLSLLFMILMILMILMIIKISIEDRFL